MLLHCAIRCFYGMQLHAVLRVDACFTTRTMKSANMSESNVTVSRMGAPSSPNPFIIAATSVSGKRGFTGFLFAV
eukprot:m.187728 g.187728  ORF g.187728 m.187728 type:complete len:75 (-) comp14777_c0_seq4:228-452(-)